nr:hypothetical protein [uncultured Bacillus sp.]
MDTRTPTGMFQMMCVTAELERNLIVNGVKKRVEISGKRSKGPGRLNGNSFAFTN